MGYESFHPTRRQSTSSNGSLSSTFPYEGSLWFARIAEPDEVACVAVHPNCRGMKPQSISRYRQAQQEGTCDMTQQESWFSSQNSQKNFDFCRNHDHDYDALRSFGSPSRMRFARKRCRSGRVHCRRRHICQYQDFESSFGFSLYQFSNVGRLLATEGTEDTEDINDFSVSSVPSEAIHPFENRYNGKSRSE
jgi:hypothetical protein